MQYLYVTSASDIRPSNRDIIKSIGGINESFLYSLIEGIDRKGFGYETISDVARSIRGTHSDFFTKGDSFVDSAGYSILSGKVAPKRIPAVIDCWTYYADQEVNSYSYLFSLDIPSSTTYPDLNKYDKIYDLNKRALLKLRGLMEKHPELKNKIYFVWHFKIAAQYHIWKRLYKELGLAEFITNRAIGGMVGLHNKTKIKFSPFTAISYRCLLDYLEAENFDNDFRLHFLGMNIGYDRFQIAVLEKLFSRYLQGLANVKMSYDSVNPASRARMNSVQPFYLFENDTLRTFGKVTETPAELIQSIYDDPDKIYTEMERYKNDDEKLRNASSFVPLRIYSNNCQDRFFEWVIDNYGLVDLIEGCKSPTELNKLHYVLKDLKKRWPAIFNKGVCQSIFENFEITHRYHQWFMQKCDDQVLDELIHLFIDRINYPFRLQ